MSLRFLRKCYFVVTTNTESLDASVGVPCANKKSAMLILAGEYSELKKQLKKKPATIEVAKCMRNGYVISVKDGPTYCGQIHEMDLQKPVNLMKVEEKENDDERKRYHYY